MAHPGSNLHTDPSPPGPGLAAPATTDELDPGRRIEEWIVSTMDDRAGPTAGADWMGSTGLIVSSRRVQSARSSAASPAKGPDGWVRFRLSRRSGITVVTLTDQALIKEQVLEELAGDLLALVEAGHRRLLLDFVAVERLSCGAAGVIAEAVRRCSSADGGVVKVSGLRPHVASIFEITGLDRGVEICPDAASAIGGPWPELPDLRPLPVSILAALMRATDESRPDPARDRQRPGFLPIADSNGIDPEGSAMTDVRLIVQDGPSTGHPVAVRGPKFVIGRGPGSHLRIGSAVVSRSHATIERRGGRLVLRDLGSTNGTVINGRALRGAEAEVRDGDRIRIGPMTLALAIGPGADRIEGLPPVANLPGPVHEGVDPETEEFADFGAILEDAGLKFEIIEDVVVVTPMAVNLDDGPTIDSFRDALIALHDRRLPGRVVVNLAHVGHLSGRAIGVLVAHHLRLDRTGGALRICLANPRVAVVLEQVRLGMLVDFHRSVDEAVVAAWPRAAEGARA